MSLVFDGQRVYDPVELFFLLMIFHAGFHIEECRSVYLDVVLYV